MSGSWVGHRFGVSLRGHGGEPLAELVELALRRNPKRAHLLVSTVLGKHVPTDPGIVHDAGLRLGRVVVDRLRAPAAVVVGYAETATGLGHCVAEALGSDYLHSTRREVDAVVPVGGFEELHSHATGHLLLPEDATLLARPGTIVLVDDEFSTGTTALNTIAELQRLAPRERYVIAALVDLRSPLDRERTAEAAARLGTSVEVVSLASGAVGWPPDFVADAQRFVAERSGPGPRAARRGEVVAVAAAWPAGVREGGRHGFGVADQLAARAAAAGQAAVLAGQVGGPRVLVLGTEELMYAPLLIALELASSTGLDVRYSTTTRSPVVAIDEPGYPIRTVLSFATVDGERFAYNVAPAAGTPPFDDIVVVVDTAGTEDLLDALRSVCARVHVVQLPVYRPSVPEARGDAVPEARGDAVPKARGDAVSEARDGGVPEALRGPAFGSYASDEVAWLLSDLSDVALEAPTEEREEAVQSGGAHYAESLPIEYQPSADYQALFTAALDESAGRLAHAVGVVTELVLDRRGADAVLVSLARAGTPVGILMRRWANVMHGLDLAHYAVSIVRGRGIDPVALRYLAARHDPSRVMFVDGWTGKGAIARELAAAVAAADPRFSPELAVLADTGSCVELYGTRQDYLIPSACLNSTVSGLVSRTVLNDRVIPPGRFHGAKFYKDLAPADVSALFLDTVSAQFAAVAADVARDWPALRDGDRTPTWAGWAAVEAISERYGIDDVNLVKPGVGETTRVLLRRVPWRILVRPGAEQEVRHVLHLAAERGVPVETVPGLAYSCVGLIHPAFTRGATGAGGTAAG